MKQQSNLDRVESRLTHRAETQVVINGEGTRMVRRSHACRRTVHAVAFLRLHRREDQRIRDPALTPLGKNTQLVDIPLAPTQSCS